MVRWKSLSFWFCANTSRVIYLLRIAWKTLGYTGYIFQELNTQTFPSLMHTLPQTQFAALNVSFDQGKVVHRLILLCSDRTSAPGPFSHFSGQCRFATNCGRYLGGLHMCTLFLRSYLRPDDPFPRPHPERSFSVCNLTLFFTISTAVFDDNGYCSSEELLFTCPMWKASIFYHN